jgi:hypothetical protein
MTERKVASNKKTKSKRDRAKEVVKNCWKPFTIGAVSTGVTIGVVIVTKRVLFPNNLAMLAKKIVIKDSVLLFSTYARDQGPPSWVIRCVETKSIFTSQLHAAKAMSLDPSSISRHLNGTKEHVNGYHFVRVAMAVPRNG